MLESYTCGVTYSSLTQRKKARTSKREALPDDARERASLIFLDHDDNDTSVAHGNKGDKCNSNDTSDSQGNKGDSIDALTGVPAASLGIAVSTREIDA